MKYVEMTIEEAMKRCNKNKEEGFIVEEKQ